MGLSNMMLAFEEALTIGDGVTALSFARNPELAKRIEIHDGAFVTALDLAMTWGHAQVCDQLLASGARVDVPIGKPPSAKYVGSTSLTRAVSTQFADEVQNHKEIIEVLGKHQAFRSREEQNESLMNDAGAQVSALFNSFADNFRSRSESFGMGADYSNKTAHIMDAYLEGEKNNLRKKHGIAIEMFETFATIKLCSQAFEFVDKWAEPNVSSRSLAKSM